MQLRHYIINSEDIRTCPKPDCGYAGTVLIDEATERIECVSPLQCAKCGAEWTDPI